jgi:hypothetical protein
MITGLVLFTASRVRTIAGRRPACSLPSTGSGSNQNTSPRCISRRPDGAAPQDPVAATSRRWLERDPARSGVAQRDTPGPRPSGRRQHRSAGAPFPAARAPPRPSGTGSTTGCPQRLPRPGRSAIAGAAHGRCGANCARLKGDSAGVVDAPGVGTGAGRFSADARRPAPRNFRFQRGIAGAIDFDDCGYGH